MKRCAKYLHDGMNVMIFPEGTRTVNGQLGVFKDGAFRLAIETQCDIIPVCVAGTENSLKVSSMLFGPSKGRVFVGRPISTKGMKLEDADKLKDTVRNVLVDMYNEIEPLTRI
jgi:1-acyl-sn-glycerol-3-phosphate acyltransferase